MGFFFLSVTALRIGGLNVCSQYPKYQSVSIITISSRRDPTVSPLLSTISRGKLQRPSVTVLFITQLFLQQLDKRSRNQTKDMSTKAGQAVKHRATDLTYPTDPSRSQWLGYSWLEDSPEEAGWDGRDVVLWDVENVVFFHFYVTVGIILSGLGSLLKGMTQLRFGSSRVG